MRREARMLLAAGAAIIACACATAPRAEVTGSAPERDPAIPSACRTEVVWAHGLMELAGDGADEMMEVLAADGAIVPPDARDRVRKDLKGRVFWRIIRGVVIASGHDNMATLALEGHATKDGQPLVLYRSAYTHAPAAEGSCYRALVHEAGVRHTVNLYSGPMPTDDLDRDERAVMEAAGGTYFNAHEGSEAVKGWRERVGHVKDDELREVMKDLAQLIRTEVLRPGGSAPVGPVHVHCGGGMHRTGMVMGVLDRCINGADDGKIVTDYRRHVAWQSAEEPGGYEQDNVDFILGFDCGLLEADHADAH